WFPLLIGVIMFTLMTTWKDGRSELARRIASSTLPMELFLEDVARRAPPRVPGTAVFMAASTTGTPPALLHHIKHNKMLHEQVVLLSILSAEVPSVTSEDRVTLRELGHGFYQLIASYGFMETPNVPELMRRAYRQGLTTDPANTSYYLGRETLLTSGRSRMMRWRKELFSFISKNSRSPTAYFDIPPGRVVELGMQVDL
ncbi:MAG: KUP/HAK/KT family potassium transporter, partial [Deltaproteobacteria bacterium]|nr:KUP/HAK/KT family potassium transporter [Deltaproteobacteria bacterium]